MICAPADSTTFWQKETDPDTKRRREGLGSERLSRPVAASREFEASRAARRNADRTEARSLGTLLKPYENVSDRALIGKTHMVEIKLLVSAEAAVRTVSNLDRIVGFPRVGTKEPKQVTLGHGRTAAGTRFQVRVCQFFV